MGRGKLTYTFSANANVLSVSAAWPTPSPPAGTTLNGLGGGAESGTLRKTYTLFYPDPDSIFDFCWYTLFAIRVDQQKSKMELETKALETISLINTTILILIKFNFNHEKNSILKEIYKNLKKNLIKLFILLKFVQLNAMIISAIITTNNIYL
jgi:hypothetical protein